MLSFAVNERSMVAEVRRRAVDLAGELGFDEGRRGEIAIVATEAASNLVKHAKDGEILIGRAAATAGVDLIAIDRGPGMANVGECMRDGYTTAGSKGIGLGAMARIPDSFDIHSQPGKGTVLATRFWLNGEPSLGLACGAVNLPYPGETECGDGWCLRDHADGGTLLVVDGLGHGPQAAIVAREACRLFDRIGESAPAAALERLHAGLRSTRGGAAAVTRIDFGAGKVTHAGIGNIAGSVVMPGETRRMVSHNGTVGHVLLRSRDFEYPLAPGAIVILHSDGLSTHWDLAQYGAAWRHHPSVLAGLLYRDHRRPKDDVTVIVAKRPM